MPKKQLTKRSKQLAKLKIARDKRKLLEKRKKVFDKQKRLSKAIHRENQRIKQLKRETGAGKYFNLTKLVETAKATAKVLKETDTKIQKFKKKKGW